MKRSSIRTYSKLFILALAITFWPGCSCLDDIKSDDKDWNIEEVDVEIDTGMNTEDIGPQYPDTSIADASDTGSDRDDVSHKPAYWDHCDVYHGEAPPPTVCSEELQITKEECSDGGGVLFDGRQCHPTEACDCNEHDECALFATIEDCAQSCSDHGWCTPDKLPHNPSGEPFCPGDGCMSVPPTACVLTDEDPSENFTGLVGASVGCSDDLQLCNLDFSNPDAQVCPEDAWCCSVGSAASAASEDEKEYHSKLCAISLMPDVKFMSCPWLE